VPATLVFGNGFRLVESPEGHLEVVGIDGGTEFISWSTLDAVQSLAEKHGVDKQSWPVYPDCEVESEVPLEDAQNRSAALRLALERVDASVVEGDYWLRFIHKILRDGHSFFVMV